MPRGLDGRPLRHPSDDPDRPQRLAAIRDQLKLLADYFDPDALEARADALEREMGEPGFWDDQERAAKVERRARARRRASSRRSARSQRDVEDLEALAELAEEDPELAAELEEQIASVERAPGRARGGAAVLRPYDAGDALVTVNAGAGGTDAQDWAEMVLRMEMRWAEKRGFEVELLEASPGEEAGIKSATFRVEGENAYGLYRRREGRPPARAAVAVRRRQPPPDELRRASRSRRWSRTSATIEIDDDDLQIDTYRASRRRRPARQQDRLGRAHHPQADRDRRPVPERALAVRQQADGDGDAALEARSSCEERKRQRGDRASERGEAQDVNFGSQIRSYVLHPYTMVKDHRTELRDGRRQRVLDGDLDGFVRAYLLRPHGS